MCVVVGQQEGIIKGVICISCIEPEEGVRRKTRRMKKGQILRCAGRKRKRGLAYLGRGWKWTEKDLKLLPCGNERHQEPQCIIFEHCDRALTLFTKAYWGREKDIDYGSFILLLMSVEHVKILKLYHRRSAASVRLCVKLDCDLCFERQVQRHVWFWSFIHIMTVQLKNLCLRKQVF